VSGYDGTGVPGRPDGIPTVVETHAERDRRRRLTERPDEVRPGKQLAIPLFGRSLVIGGQLETKLDFDRNRELESPEDERARLIPTAELELFYPVSETVSLFAEVKYTYEWHFHRDDGRQSSEHRPLRGETWIQAEDPWGSGLGAQVGRQNFRDERKWWWDRNLDALRVSLERPGLHAEVAVAEELAPEDPFADFVPPDGDDVFRILASASWRYAKRHELEVFALHANDHSRTESVGRVLDAEREDESDADLTWVGARALGRLGVGIFGDLHYWGGGAFVTGEESTVDFDALEPGRSRVDSVVTRDVSGWALDVGLTWETDLSLVARPSLTLGYAIGSGDEEPRGGGAFRQTGLQRNDGKFQGVNAFRYYGELLDPELSNLHVTTTALGHPFLESSSVELVYHYYRQVQAAEGLSSRIKASPDGRNPSIGHELDLVLGFEEWERRRVELVGSVFRAGAAYGERRGELAFGAGFEVEIAF